MGLFPAYIESRAAEKRNEKVKAVPREYGIDFVTGQLTGEIVEGKEALKVWIWLALHTPRYRHYIYTWDYGNEFESLIGQGYSEEYTKTEARRMTEECLLANEHIRGITDFYINMEGDTLTISFTADTLYGSIAFNQPIPKTA